MCIVPEVPMMHRSDRKVKAACTAVRVHARDESELSRRKAGKFLA